MNGLRSFKFKAKTISFQYEDKCGDTASDAIVYVNGARVGAGVTAVSVIGQAENAPLVEIKYLPEYITKEQKEAFGIEQTESNLNGGE